MLLYRLFIVDRLPFAAVKRIHAVEHHRGFCCSIYPCKSPYILPYRPAEQQKDTERDHRHPYAAFYFFHFIPSLRKNLLSDIAEYCLTSTVNPIIALIRKNEKIFFEKFVFSINSKGAGAAAPAPLHFQLRFRFRLYQHKKLNF